LLVFISFTLDNLNTHVTRIKTNDSFIRDTRRFDCR